MTTFSSNQYNVTSDNLSSAFNHFVTDVDSLNLWDISVRPSGHGHYRIQAIFNVDGKELTVNKTTSDMPLIDAWKSGMNDSFEDGGWYENWDEVAESIISALNADDDISEFINE
tara:strand:- start:1820 stop:2161 length:342 start_codon:yes stop_codon:yes gene_type:complete